MVEQPVIIYFVDTLSPVKRKHATWVYLWRWDTIITLVNYDNPIPDNDFLDWVGQDEEQDIHKVAQQLIDRGYKKVDDPEAIAGIYSAVIAEMRRNAFYG